MVESGSSTSIRSLRSLRSPNDGSTAWDLLESEKTFKPMKNSNYNRPTVHRLRIPIIYSSIALLGLLEQSLGAILGRFNTILGRLALS